VFDDGPDPLDGLAGGVGEVPVDVALARVHRAGVAASHGDDHVGLPGQGVGESLGDLPGRVETPLLQDLGHRRVDRLGRLGTGGPHPDPTPGVVIEEHAGGHAAPRVVDAQEEHDGLGLHTRASVRTVSVTRGYRIRVAATASAPPPSWAGRTWRWPGATRPVPPPPGP